VKLAAVVVTLAACDPQVDGTYAGDAFVRVRGTTVGFPSDTTIDGAAVRWTAQGGADLESGPTTELPLESAPPAVVVPVVSLPPDDASFGFAGEPARIAEGSLFLTDRGNTVGRAIDYALVYIDGDVAAGSLAADYLGDVLAPGFHLCEVRPTASLTPAQAYFARQCGSTSACTQPRLYRLVPLADDLDADVEFFRSAP
jgi:hypothetical protein